MQCSKDEAVASLLQQLLNRFNDMILKNEDMILSHGRWNTNNADLLNRFLWMSNVNRTLGAIAFGFLIYLIFILKRSVSAVCLSRRLLLKLWQKMQPTRG